jgi:hypothetical protein
MTCSHPAVAAFASSISISRVRIFQPFLIVGSALAAVGAGLIYTFNLNTKMGSVIGFQILFGVGIGLVIQVPVIVGGALSAMKDKTVALSTVCGE